MNAADVIDDEDATIKSSASRDDTACVQSVKVKTMSTDKGDMVEREVKLADKIKALDLLGKHLGMWDDKVQADLQGDVTFHMDYGDDNEDGDAE